MKIVVFGGTGRIGAHLIEVLREGGEEAVAASLATGVDAYTGLGVAEAVRGAEVVVDLLKTMFFDRASAVDFFATTSRTLLDAERAAGVRRHVALSVVGVDRLVGSDFMAGKLAQEAAIVSGGVPFTIVRSTQFIEFLPEIADECVVGDRIVVPATSVQPIAARDVAAALAAVVRAPAPPRRMEIAGPQRLKLAEALRRALGPDEQRPIVEDRHAAYFGAHLVDDELIPLGDAQRGATTIGDVFPRVATPQGSVR